MAANLMSEGLGNMGSSFMCERADGGWTEVVESEIQLNIKALLINSFESACNERAGI
jgi:hypothetical protein